MSTAVHALREAAGHLRAHLVRVGLALVVTSDRRKRIVRAACAAPRLAILWRPEWHREVGPARSPVRLVLDLDETLIGSLSLVAALKVVGIWRAARSRSVDSQLMLLAGMGIIPDNVFPAGGNPQLLFVRPGLDAFLASTLGRFAAVGIWSAASDEWVECVLGTGPLAKHRRCFAFVWHGSRCVRAAYESRHTKPLKKVWRSTPGWTRANTVILDDRADNFARNYGNGIRIPPFDVKARLRELASARPPCDDMLAAFTRYSVHEVLTWTDVRPPEKRGWHQHLWKA